MPVRASTPWRSLRQGQRIEVAQEVEDERPAVGETSTEVQVPSETSKAIFRASSRGALTSAATSFFVGAGVAVGEGVDVGVGVGVSPRRAAVRARAGSRLLRIERTGTSCGSASYRCRLVRKRK
jgi:hypothetical protein